MCEIWASIQSVQEMNIEEIRQYCIDKKGVTEGLPFGPDVLVFKVMNKMFALLALEATPHSINLKCEPELALELRAQYPAVKPGYHMNKQHWNTISVDGSFNDSQLREWIDNSYNLIVATLKKADREKLITL